MLQERESIDHTQKHNTHTREEREREREKKIQTAKNNFIPEFNPEESIVTAFAFSWVHAQNQRPPKVDSLPVS